MNAVIDKLISQLRFPLTIGVVMVHSNPIELYRDGGVMSAADIESFGECMRFINCMFPASRIVVFFVIAGFLFFANARVLTMGVYKRKISARFVSLLIPFVLWNLIAVMTRVTVKLVLNEGGEALPYDEIFTLQGFYQVFADPILIPLWFLRNLIVFALLTPLIFMAIRRFRWFAVVAMVGFHYVDVSCLAGIGYFAFGAACGILCSGDFLVSRIDLLKYSIPVWILMSIFSYSFPPTGLFVTELSSFMLVVSSAGGLIWISYKVDVPCMVSLARTSFFIFCAHGIFSPYIMKTLYLVMPKDGVVYAHVVFVLSLFLTTALTLVLFGLLSRCMPLLHGVLTGRRRFRILAMEQPVSQSQKV